MRISALVPVCPAFIALLGLALLPGCRSRDARCPTEGRASVCGASEEVAGGVVLECVDGRIEAETPCATGDACRADVGCVPCALELPAALAIPIDRTPADAIAGWERLRWRALPIDGPVVADAEIEVEPTGPFEVWVTDTADAMAPDAVLSRVEAGTAVRAPTTLWIRATAGGSGTVTVTPSGCTDATPIAVTARRDPGLTATPRALEPRASFVDAFPDGSILRIGLDPIRFPLRHADGDSAPVWVVADRDAQGWLDDPVLVDALGADPLTDAERQVSAAADTLVGNLFEIWPVDVTAPGDIGPGDEGLRTGPARFDVVIDWDSDGRLSPGDTLDGLDGPGFTAFPDLARPGPWTPRIDEVSQSFFITQRVYWPLELDDFDAPVPLVVISHGNGHDYDWYDFLGTHLASWGYVVMAHRNDTGPGVQAAATTTLNNTDAFIRNRELIAGALGPGVDEGRIVWIGHSRGGEGILVAHERLRSGTANVQELVAEDIVLLSSIAPTVFESVTTSSPGDVPMHLLSGSADGDVTGGVASFGAPCSLCQWWRLLQDGTAENYVTYLHGAIHNDFNCCGPNDGTGVNAPKLGRIATHRYVQALYTALLAATLDGDAAAAEYLRRLPEDLALPLPDGAKVATQSRLALDPPDGRWLETFQSDAGGPPSDPEGGPWVSSEGLAVRTDALEYIEGRLDDGNLNFASNVNDPMNGMTQSDGDPPQIAARGAVLGWDGAAFWEVDLPDDARDLTAFTHVAMRVAQSTRHPATVELDDTLAFGVAFIDGSGNEVVLQTAPYGRITKPYPRGQLGAGSGWANEFNTVRLPLADFESLGLDRADVRTLRLRFGPDVGSPVGRVGLDDVVLEARGWTP
jgi:hypothetical protein